MNWIKCSDRMPESKEKVLTINASGKIQVAIYTADWISPWDGELWECHWNDDGCCSLYLDGNSTIPTHWQPLPAAPVAVIEE